MIDKGKLCFILIIAILLVSYVVICSRFLIIQPTRKLCSAYGKLSGDKINKDIKSLTLKWD